MSSTDEIIEAITQYQPERDNWTGLDTLLEEARAHPGATYSAREAVGRYVERHQAPA